MINNLPKANRAESVIEAKEKAQLSIQFGAYSEFKPCLLVESEFLFGNSLLEICFADHSKSIEN